ncbi:ABC transporter permease [Thalassospira alkalitolerans]|uniref:ABC transporter permease n=1 Tax=Thalassospira alkalitolerans TaxID=1293890 RepID=A0A1Y2LBU7_9PROT|nr:ABC transporter permease subunit [Thalassospira alkalitolerans]OSQ47773.1 ABC transporter permease [Thalassospira alkalitolerans]|tara:strand:- start:43227 stop:44012 length:786 start_codon:yes stop_codon:yes gene_type:complete
MGLVTFLYTLYLIAPIALLLVGSFGTSWTNSLLPTGFTLDWYREVIGDASFRRAFMTSLEVVAATCVVNVVLGVPFAYAVFSAANRGVRLAARIFTLLPVAVPELVLGFGFIIVFSSDYLPWLGTTWLLICAHIVLTLPYLVATLLGDMDRLGIADMEKVAETLGAGFWQRFRDIVLPSLRYSLLSGLMMVTAISIGEFQISNLVAGFLSRPYPVVLLQAFYGATGLACAATVILIILALLAAFGGAAGAHLAQLRQKVRA